MYKEYVKLKNKYELETDTLEKAMERAQQVRREMRARDGGGEAPPNKHDGRALVSSEFHESCSPKTSQLSAFPSET